ncbi:MAG: hypothetical protein H6729_17385 [Deltaproteobacteria bacterium]|nr:hypothetical protein [Deltaproteobacteria bacterium]
MIERRRFWFLGIVVRVVFGLKLRLRLRLRLRLSLPLPLRLRLRLSLPLRPWLGSSVLFWLGIVGVGCASSNGLGRITERHYERPNLRDMSIQSIEVAVVISGPPRSAGPRLDRQDAFPPPTLEGHLADRERDPTIEAAVIASSTTALAALGYDVRARKDLSRSTTLKSIFATSEADAVLVLRGVPYDRFYVHPDQESRAARAPKGTDFGPGVSAPARPVERRGLLILGQAFLWRRADRLRLFSRQIPDFPEFGRIRETSRFLRYGVVQPLVESGDIEARPRGEVHDAGDAPDGQAVERGQVSRAAQAAPGFVREMLRDLPLRARDRAPVDAESDLSPDPDLWSASSEDWSMTFFDESHIAFEFLVGWSGETMGDDVSLRGGSSLSFSTGALAPGGQTRFAVRGSRVGTSGFVAYAEGALGIAPNRFERLYYDGEGVERLALGASHIFGLSAGIGQAKPVWPSVFFVPTLGAFTDVWLLDPQSSTVPFSKRRARIGLEGLLSLTYGLGTGAPVFGRIFGGGRLGWDSEGPAFVGVTVGAAAGVSL